MIKQIFIPAVLICLLSASFTSAGTADVGNGGDVVVCWGRYFDKFLSLDYVLGKDLFFKLQIVETKSATKNLERIAKLLTTKVPALDKSFQEFLAQLKNQNSSLKYVWRPTYEDLTDIEDEEFDRFPMGTCADINFQRGGELRQAIVRRAVLDPEYNKTKIVFLYNQSIYAELEKRHPLQLSFLLIHEWLWNFSTDVKINREVNYFLHSSALEEKKADQVVKALQGLGLEIPGL